MIQPISTKSLCADGFQWNQYSNRVATITNSLQHFSTVAYFAFDSWDRAHAFWKSITDKRYCTRAQVREAERFKSGWECKVWGMPDSVLEKLIERDRTQLPQPLPISPLQRDWSRSDSYSSISYEAA